MHVELPELPLTFIPEGTVGLCFEGDVEIELLDQALAAMDRGDIPKMFIIIADPGTGLKMLNEGDARGGLVSWLTTSTKPAEQSALGRSRATNAVSQHRSARRSLYTVSNCSQQG